MHRPRRRHLCSAHSTPTSTNMCPEEASSVSPTMSRRVALHAFKSCPVPCKACTASDARSVGTSIGMDDNSRANADTWFGCSCSISIAICDSNDAWRGVPVVRCAVRGARCVFRATSMRANSKREKEKKKRDKNKLNGM